MSDDLCEPWQRFFSPAGPPARMALLRRGGEPFLLLPSARSPAAESLALYAAQSSRARAAKATLRWALRWGLAFGLENVTLRLGPEDAFVGRLCAVEH